MTALVMGNFMHMLEPVWSKAVHLPPVNDPSYKTMVAGRPSFQSWEQRATK